MQVTETNLQDLKDKANALKSSDFENFNAFFNHKMSILKPCSEWAKQMFNVAKKKSGQNVDHFVTERDNACYKIYALPKEEQEEARKKHYTFYEDDEMRVSAWLDYDFGYKLCKYNVTRKSDGFFYRETEMIRKLDD